MRTPRTLAHATLVLLGLVLLLSSLVGCGSGGGGTGAFGRTLTGEFVGQVTGTQAYVGIATYDDGFAVAYVCDGAQLSRWLVGSVLPDGTLDLAPHGGVALTGAVVGATATGTVTIAAQPFAFQAGLPAPGAGYFGAAQTVDGGLHTGGWLLLGDGTQRGAVRNASGIAGNPVLGPSSSSVTLVSGSVLLVRRINQWVDPEPQPFRPAPWVDPDPKP